MLLVTLRLLAEASYLDVSWPYGIGCSSVYHVFSETLCSLNLRLPSIHFPQTAEERRGRANLFQKLRSTPLDCVCPAFDGIAIEIRRLSLQDAPDPMKYYNRKNVFGLCVRAALQADYKFSFISARHSGGTHDSTASSTTKLFSLLQGDDVPRCASVVACEAHFNKPRVLTPYPGRNLSPAQYSFNAYHSHARFCVEQAFGMLICRFGIFWWAIRYSLRQTTLMIMVACKLHKIVIDCANENVYEFIPHHKHNHVTGGPVIHLQDVLHTKRDKLRARNRARETSTLRDELAERLQALGFVRRRAL